MRVLGIRSVKFLIYALQKNVRQAKKKIDLMCMFMLIQSRVRACVCGFNWTHISAIAIVQRRARSPKFKFSLLPIPTFHMQILIDLSIFLCVCARLNGRFPNKPRPQKAANAQQIFALKSILFAIDYWHVQNSHFHSTFHVKSYLINFFLWTECDSFTCIEKKTVNNQIVDINT